MQAPAPTLFHEHVMPGSCRLRPREWKDIPAVIELMRKVYAPMHGPEAIWPPEALEEHLVHFPQGQLLLESRGHGIVADSTSFRTTSEIALRPHTWSGITARGTLASHDPAGDVFYGVDIAVDPRFQGLGLAKSLYEARITIARRLGCRRFVAGARIPGLHLHPLRDQPQRYLEEVAAGRVFDPTLSKQIRLGFRVRGLLRDYIRDRESCNHAALISMEL
jgi:ribosomal protein S18 acetylase RimI-like enzyme